MTTQDTLENESFQRNPHLLAEVYIKFTTSNPLKAPSADRTPIEMPDDIGDESDPRRVFWEYFNDLNRYNVLDAYNANLSQLGLEAEEINNLLDWIDRKITIYSEKKKVVRKIPHDPLLESKVLITICEMFNQFPERDAILLENSIPRDLQKLYPTPPETVHERCLSMVIRALDSYLLRTATIEAQHIRGFRLMLISMRSDYKAQLRAKRPELFKEDSKHVEMDDVED